LGIERNRSTKEEKPLKTTRNPYHSVAEQKITSENIFRKIGSANLLKIGNVQNVFYNKIYIPICPPKIEFGKIKKWHLFREILRRLT
jgi:hypothetical protein